MPRKRDRDAPRVVYRTARCGLRLTRHQQDRLFGLLRSAGDVWCCVLELSSWRRRRQDRPLAGYQELCRELAAAGPGTFGELDSAGARSVLRRYSDSWFATAKRRRAGDVSARFPRRKRGLVPVRWYAGTFALEGRVLRLPVARGCPPLLVRLDRDVPYPAGKPGPVGDARVRCRAAVPGCDRRGPGRRLPAGPRTGPGAGGRRGPGHHPPVRGRGAGRAGAAGVRAGGPLRMAPAPARLQGPQPGRRPPRAQAGAARVPAVAQAPARAAAGRGPARTQGPAGPARGRQDGDFLGGAAPGRHAGGRRPARRPGPERGPAA